MNRMEQVLKFLNSIFPEGIIYCMTVLIFLYGVMRCSRPLLSSAAHLRHATGMLEEGAKQKLSRPIWNDPGFLGKQLQPIWRGFLQSVGLSQSARVPCDVADYIHEDVLMMGQGRAALADIIPGLCTSLGILGTFVGLSLGLNRLDLTDLETAGQLTSGMALAFNTSIVGMIGSICFNIINRYAAGRARQAISDFTAAFYAYAIPQPPDATTQLLAYQREQSDALGQFAEDMSVRMAGEIQHAITNAMAPVQDSMEDFLNAATRAQVDGLDYIVARFIDRMNTALEGQLHRLGEALSQTSEGQLRAQEDLRGALDMIGKLTSGVSEVQGVSQDLLNKFARYVTQMEGAASGIADSQGKTTKLLEEISKSSQRQSQYLSALQAYQADLQASFQDYTIWTDSFVTGLEERTAAQKEALERVATEMRGSSELLRGAYKSFVESIELGLANALGLFDENMQNLTRQIHGTLSDIQETMVSLEQSMNRAAGMITVNQEVS